MNINARRFLYNGYSSERFHLLLCDFDKGSGFTSSSAGSTITLSTSKAPSGSRWNYFNQEYSEPITFELSAAKQEGETFSSQELAAISRWLIRKDGYKSFQFDSVELSNIIFHAVATKIDKIAINGEIVGLTISFTCDAPFGYSPIIKKQHNFSRANDTFQLSANSDEIGFVYPKMIITAAESCNLSITNKTTSEVMRINNCASGEIITIDNNSKQLYSSFGVHKLADDFNFKWFRFIREEFNVKNSIQVSHPCNIEFQYQFIRKVGV